MHKYNREQVMEAILGMRPQIGSVPLNIASAVFDPLPGSGCIMIIPNEGEMAERIDYWVNHELDLGSSCGAVFTNYRRQTREKQALHLFSHLWPYIRLGTLSGKDVHEALMAIPEMRDLLGDGADRELWGDPE